MSEQPLVSLVIPSLSQGRFIGAAIERMPPQYYPRSEHIVVDGGSTDETLDVLRACNHLRWVSESDAGQADAVNQGFRMPAGEIYTWLNADDLYLSGAIATGVRALQETVAALVHGGWRQIDEDGNTIRDVGPVPFDHAAQLNERNAVSQRGSLVTCEAFWAVGGLDPSYRYAMDYELWLKLGARFSVCHVDEVLGGYRLHTRVEDGLRAARLRSGDDPREPRVRRAALLAALRRLVPAARASMGVPLRAGVPVHAEHRHARVRGAGRVPRTQSPLVHNADPVCAPGSFATSSVVSWVAFSSLQNCMTPPEWCGSFTSWNATKPLVQRVEKSSRSRFTPSYLLSPSMNTRSTARPRNWRTSATVTSSCESRVSSSIRWARCANARRTSAHGETVPVVPSGRSSIATRIASSAATRLGRNGVPPSSVPISSPASGRRCASRSSGWRISWRSCVAAMCVPRGQRALRANSSASAGLVGARHTRAILHCCADVTSMLPVGEGAVYVVVLGAQLALLLAARLGIGIAPYYALAT
jgi:hypothetical protein